MNKSEVKVIGLVGLPRSGTTIAAEFLGAHDEYFNCGELQSLVTRSIVRRGKCQCGETVFTCDFWSNVLNCFSPAEIQSLQWLRKHLLTAIAMLTLGSGAGKVRGAAEALLKLYTLASKATGNKILIDTSKNPLWHYLVELVLREHVYFIIWYRRSRDIIASFESRRQPYEGLRFATYVFLRKLLFSKVSLKLQQHYADFVREPGTLLEKVDKLVGCRIDKDNSRRDYTANTFLRDTGHSVAGNPSRLVKGVITIEPSSADSRISRKGRLLAAMIDTFR